MVKFRTMVADAEERLPELVDLENLDEPAFKIRDDPRVTRSGRFLRRTSLDELPQLFNVLRGEMSLVGPRPEEESVVALYDERQRSRLAIKPGMTGPMQVYGRSDLTFEERLAMERDYLDNLSLLTDLADPDADAAGDGPRRRRLLASPAMPRTPDLEVVIVSHGAEALLRRCLRSLREHPPPRARCGSPWSTAAAPTATPEMVAREFPEVRLLRDAPTSASRPPTTWSCARARPTRCCC